MRPMVANHPLLSRVTSRRNVGGHPAHWPQREGKDEIKSQSLQYGNYT
jgi:hypothetical protein